MYELPLALLLLSIVVAIKGVKVVSQADLVVIERLGKYNKTLSGGLNFIIPVIDSVRSKLTLQEQTIDIPSQSVITKDNVSIIIDGVVFAKVEDAKSATYNVLDFKNAISTLAQTTLRSAIGSMELDECLSNRESLNARLQTELGDAAAIWGVKITRVEISDISVPQEIERAMQMQMEAERKKRATLTTAEAEKEAAIREAEAVKQSEFLKAEAIERMADAQKYEKEIVAEGEKNAMKSINEAMEANQLSSEFLLAKDRIAAFKSLAESGSNDKMILPYEVSQMVGNMSIIGDSFFAGNKQNQQNT